MEDLHVTIHTSATEALGQTVYESLNGSPQILAFHPGPEAENSARYIPIVDLPQGARSITPAEWLFVVGLDLQQGHEADFEDWYNVEHLPGLAAVEGVRRAVRYRLDTAASDMTGTFPPYLALYEVESPEIPGNPDWSAAVNTPWTVRLRQHFTARWRGCYQLLD